MQPSHDNNKQPSHHNILAYRRSCLLHGLNGVNGMHSQVSDSRGNTALCKTRRKLSSFDPLFPRLHTHHQARTAIIMSMVFSLWVTSALRAEGAGTTLRLLAGAAGRARTWFSRA